MNPLRRFTYRCFDVITLREERSAEFVRELMGDDVELEVTADSALQHRVEPIDRAEWTVDGGTAEDRFVVLVSAIDAKYQGAPDPAARRAVYDRSIVAAVDRLADRVGRDRLHVAFMPQLHSRKHRDAPYLERLGRMLGADISWELLSAQVRSDEQRSRFAAADLVIAGRYHPAVFAVSAGVPVLCIPYEHKAAGLMEAAGQAAHVVELADVTEERLTRAVDRLFDELDEVKAQLRAAEPALRRRARRTSELVAGVLLRGDSGRPVSPPN
jgi:colanic acid/amylovoran biosynthesis protein